jgi:putative transposase
MPADVVGEALGVSRATIYRSQVEPPDPGCATLTERRPPPRTLTIDQREDVLCLLHSERFIDEAPAAVYATLLDEEVYVCSVSTMYRILRAKNEVRERRKQRAHSHYQKPELLATGPNQLWSWDITKLLGPQKWTYYYLYVIMDVFSRYVVGWMIAPRETAGLAEALIAQTCRKQNIEPDHLTIHADRGSAMTSKPVAFLLADMGVTKTHSRPHVSNDNPYSEAQFKTLKYRPDFPDRFGSIQDARAFCQTFFAWYNQEHRHSGIAMMTPENVHYGRTDQIIAARQRVLTNAYSRHPERFVRKQPVHQPLPKAAWINPPAISQ